MAPIAHTHTTAGTRLTLWQRGHQLIGKGIEITLWNRKRIPATYLLFYVLFLVHRIYDVIIFKKFNHAP